jgi:hypothetical protein
MNADVRRKTYSGKGLSLNRCKNPRLSVTIRVPLCLTDVTPHFNEHTT